MRAYIDIINEQNMLAEAGAGPARVLKHIKDGQMFFMISAYRSDRDLTENKQRSSVLKSNLAKNAALSFIQTQGEYHEAGQESSSPEESFFVLPRSPKVNADAFKRLGLRLMKMFEQEAILYGDGVDVFLVEQNGHEENIGDVVSFDPNVIETLPGHSSIKGRKFSFATPDAASGGNQYGIPDAPEDKWGLDMNKFHSMMGR